MAKVVLPTKWSSHRSCAADTTSNRTESQAHETAQLFLGWALSPRIFEATAK